MDMYKKVLLGCTTLTALSSSVFAGGDADYDRALILDQYATTYTEAAFIPFFELLLFGGIATLDADDSTIFITDNETDKLVQTNDGDWDSWTGQLGVGYVAQLADNLSTGGIDWFPIINPQVNAYYLGGDIEGDVWRFEDPDFNQATYSMDFESVRLMFDLAITVAQIKRFSIYAIGGAGIAWNSIDFEARADEECPIVDIDLDSESDTGFVYEFGGGLTYALMDDVAISLEYLYTVFNDIELGDDDDNEQGFDIQGSDMDLNSQAVLLGLRFAL